MKQNKTSLLRVVHKSRLLRRCTARVSSTRFSLVVPLRLRLVSHFYDKKESGFVQFVTKMVTGYPRTTTFLLILYIFEHSLEHINAPL